MNNAKEITNQTNHLTFLIFTKSVFKDVTRKVAQPAKITAVLALVLLMVVGMGGLFADDSAQIELDTFGDLLDGVASEVLVTPIQTQINSDQISEPRAELFVHQESFLKAFNEVIQNNIL